jgi:hypothetical protein
MADEQGEANLVFAREEVTDALYNSLIVSTESPREAVAILALVLIRVLEKHLRPTDPGQPKMTRQEIADYVQNLILTMEIYAYEETVN